MPFSNCVIMDRDNRPELRQRVDNTTCNKIIKKCDNNNEFVTMTSICCNVNCLCKWNPADGSRWINPSSQTPWIRCVAGAGAGATCEDCLESFVRNNNNHNTSSTTTSTTQITTFQLFPSHPNMLNMLTKNSLITRTLTIGHRWISVIKKSGLVRIKKLLLNQKACFSIPLITILLLSLISPCYMYDSLKSQDQVPLDHHTSSGNARNSRSFYESSSANLHNADNRHNPNRHKSHDSDITANPAQQRPSSSSCSSCVEIRKELKIRNLEFIKNQVLLKLGFTQAPNISSIPKMSAQRMKELLKNWSASVPGVDFGMQGDDPNVGEGFGDMWSEGKNLWKEGVSVHEEDYNDFHARTEKVIAFAQPCKSFFFFNYFN